MRISTTCAVIVHCSDMMNASCNKFGDKASRKHHERDNWEILGPGIEWKNHEKTLSGRRTQNAFFTFWGILVGVTEKVAEGYLERL